MGAESTNTSTAGIDKHHSTTFTLLPVIGTQRYIWTKVDAVRISHVATWGFIVGLNPQEMLQAPQIELWNAIIKKSFCQILL